LPPTLSRKSRSKAGDNFGWVVGFVSIFQNPGARRWPSRLTEGVFRRIGLRLGSGAAPAGKGQFPLRSGGHGIPGWALRPATGPSEEGEGARRPTNVAAKRREASAPASLGREAPRFRCFSRAASWHAHGAAIRTRASRRFAPSRGRCVGMNAKPGSQRSLDTSARPPGGAERRLFDIVNLDNRDAHMRTPIALACRP
jgi:hypothetical protein